MKRDPSGCQGGGGVGPAQRPWSLLFLAALTLAGAGRRRSVTKR
jgi:hypothetical protein